MSEDLNLKGGVLIIGSLLWQDHLDEKGDDISMKWRNNHLLLSDKIMVKIPIRYGRFSIKNNIYTMTFSKKVNRSQMGTGYFLPFKNESINSIEDLLSEVSALSEAEGMNKNFATNWSAIGIMFNKNVQKNVKANLLRVWKDELKNTNVFKQESYKILKSESPCIKKNGELNFDWIKTVDPRQTEKLNSYDFLIATATLPTKYPTITELAVSIKSDNERFYFIENFKNGITTFQDISVLNLINQL